MIKKIENQLKGEKNFVLYRLPGEKKVKGILSDLDSIVSISKFSDLLPTCEGFLFAPYNFNLHPSFLICPKMVFDVDIPSDFFNRILSSHNHLSNSSPNKDYQSAFLACHRKLSEKEEINKLVLARSKRISTNEKNPIEIFLNACTAYPDAMVYWLNTSLTGTWMGATPELFLSGNCQSMKTVALAGSQSFVVKDRNDLCMWDEKNREEQNLVEEYLKNKISSFGNLIKTDGPFSSQAGHIAHLKSELSFSIDKNALFDFISSTHPTPAICGLPQSAAKEFLMQQESFDRLYFSGLLGWLAPENDSNLFVNLRCLKWDSDDSVTLFAGSGLLATSELNSEWMETESKMETLKRLFD